jgi:hypothetical protein
MKRLFNPATDKTYSSIVGAFGCIILFCYATLENSWTNSLKHFLLLLLLLIYVAAMTALTEFLTNKDFFMEQREAKKKFLVTNSSFLLALVFVLSILYVLI